MLFYILCSPNSPYFLTSSIKPLGTKFSIIKLIVDVEYEDDVDELSDELGDDEIDELALDEVDELKDELGLNEGLPEDDGDCD